MWTPPSILPAFVSPFVCFCLWWPFQRAQIFIWKGPVRLQSHLFSFLSCQALPRTRLFPGPQQSLFYMQPHRTLPCSYKQSDDSIKSTLTQIPFWNTSLRVCSTPFHNRERIEMHCSSTVPMHSDIHIIPVCLSYSSCHLSLCRLNVAEYKVPNRGEWVSEWTQIRVHYET